MGLSKLFIAGRILQRGGLRTVGSRVLSTSNSRAKEQCDDKTEASEWSAAVTTMMTGDGGGRQIQDGNKISAVMGAYKLKDGTYTLSEQAKEIFCNAAVICFQKGNGGVPGGLSHKAYELNKAADGKLGECYYQVLDRMELAKPFVFTDVAGFSAVALVHSGNHDSKISSVQSHGLQREDGRWAVAAGARALMARGAETIEVDPGPTLHPYVYQACAEAAELAVWQFNDYVSSEDRRPSTTIKLMTGCPYQNYWDMGSARGKAQNWARFLSDTPANKMTPIDLAQEATDVLCPLGVKVVAHDRAWIEAQRMEAFLAVARGSCEEPVFLECTWKHNDGPTVLLAAKGVTFDSGGLSLKKREHMVENRGSMAGAAATLATLKALAELKEIGKMRVPLNVVLVIPLCENMISGQCMKVGDVVRTLSGLNVLIEDTDMEGRLMLADALVYGQAVHRPDLVIDVATLTHGIQRALGSGAFGAFTNDEALWRCLHKSGVTSGDRPWRFPLWDYYHRRIVNDPSVDLRNRGSGKGSPCLGAAFLKNFVCGRWIHMDTTGVAKLAHEHEAPPYLIPGRMTGRPTRTLIHLLEDLSSWA